LAKTDFSSVSIIVLLRIPPSGLHTMMTTKSMKILSNSVLILGEMMMEPQISRERLYPQEFCLPTLPLEKVQSAMNSITLQW
jgi:hypothetical protein